MFASLKQGITGLLLFASNMFLPPGEQAALSVKNVTPVHDNKYEVTLKMDMHVNERLEQLIDAGVPLRFRFMIISDRKDTVSFYRVLKYQVIDYTYTYTDSMDGYIQKSEDFPMILLALKSFSKITIMIAQSTQSCKVEADILPSRVSRLNRTVDMSNIWGQRNVSISFNPKNHLDASKKAGKKRKP